MPDPLSARLTRRHVLAGAAAVTLALAGCTTGAPRPVPAPPKDPLEDLLDAHVALRAAYDVAATTVPGDSRLAPLRANLDRHVTALAGALAVPPPSAAGSAASTAAGSAGPAAPTEPAGVLPALAQSEAALGAQCRALAISQPARRAPLLASLAASHAAAAAVLG